MIKSFLITISFSILLHSSQQIILVVSDDYNSSKASLECYEDGIKKFKTVNANIGKNGLGWGLGFKKIKHDKSDLNKREGDKKAPIGIFKLSSLFGYEKNKNYKMNYIHVNKNYTCVDDSKSKHYNTILDFKDKSVKSFEYMKRKDEQYKLGIVVEHNRGQIPYAGSCIFIHVQKAENASTAGCTSMSFNEIKKITLWLDKEKNPILIQIPKSSGKEILKLYPELKNSKLLKEEN